jgi:ABC-type transporter Mla MlaB component
LSSEFGILEQLLQLPAGQEKSMLKITMQNDLEATTLWLEGRLAGPWVKELESCWRKTAETSAGGKLRIDLNGVTFIDAAGKDLLARMHEQGAALVAVECMTKAVIESIVRTPAWRPHVSNRSSWKRSLSAPEAN